ncbi:MAG: PHB depolymerase family esterase, partial [Solirubrobacteraceae bacterium]
LLYHGFSSDAENMIEKFSEYAYQNGYVLVAPNGMPDRRGRTAWNAGACCSVVTNRRYDDLTYSTKVLEITRKSLGLNLFNTKLFVAGFSNGAMMAHHFACSYPDRVDGIAAISGPMNSETCDKLTTIPHPIPVWSSHSKNDPIVPFKGGIH